MNRDHLLGWPPALLALDPEPKPVQRTRTYHRRTDTEQQTCRDLDAALTARLDPTELKSGGVDYAVNPDIRVRARCRHKVHPDLYRLIDGAVHYWAERRNNWQRPVGPRDWDGMVPASSVQLQRLPPEALE